MKKTLFNKVLLSLASLLALSCSSDETTEAHAQPTNMGKTLVVCYSYTGNCRTSSLLEQWLATQNFQTSTAMTKIFITIGGQAQSMTLADTQAARELAARLQQGPLSLTLSSNGDFEIWGALGFSLPASNEHITAQPGDVVLYNGSNICIFFGSNSWSYTRLGHISGLTESQLRSFLKAGERNISAVLLLGSTTSLQQPQATRRSATGSIALNGMPAPQAAKGIYIQDGKKHIKTSTRK